MSTLSPTITCHGLFSVDFPHVGVEGLEPSRLKSQWILSPPRMPIPPHSLNREGYRVCLYTSPAWMDKAPLYPSRLNYSTIARTQATLEYSLLSPLLTTPNSIAIPSSSFGSQFSSISSQSSLRSFSSRRRIAELAASISCC